MSWTIRVVVLCLCIGVFVTHEQVAAQADAGAARRARGEEAFHQALAKLKSPKAEERAAAADEMGRRGYRFRDEIAEVLRPMLVGDAESVVRAAAGRALGRLGAREAVPELVQALSDKTVEVRVVAAAALWRLPDPSAVPVLLERVKDTDKAVREWSALALGVAGDPRAVPALIDLLDDSERNVRLAAVRSLGRLNHPDALKPLNEYVLGKEKRDDEERAEVVNSIASISGPQRVVTLIDQLEGMNRDTRQRLLIVMALGKVGDGQALPVLRKLSQRDGTRAVRDAATQAYAEVLGRTKASKGAAGPDGTVRADAGRAPDATP